MNLSTVAGWSLSFALSTAALCSASSVEVISPSESSRTIRLTVLLAGTPEKGVKIEIYRYEAGPGEEASPRSSLISDDHGTVQPPKLSPGHYHVIASTGTNLRADLYLDVLAHSRKTFSVFSMELFANPNHTREQLLTETEKSPVIHRVREFRGEVYDQSGAMIPGVSIEVVRTGSAGKDRVAQLRSESDGQFFARLSNGNYVAFFYMSGFRTQIVHFEVNDQGSADLTVTLQIASST